MGAPALPLGEIPGSATIGPMAKAKKQKQPFNVRMEALVELVEELEQGDLDLEKAIARFEEGRQLHQDLLGDLDAYEKRLEQLIVDSDGKDRLESVTEDGDQS